jgi:hypothetical protein
MEDPFRFEGCDCVDRLSARMLSQLACGATQLRLLRDRDGHEVVRDSSRHEGTYCNLRGIEHLQVHLTTKAVKERADWGYKG